jgi:cytochrome c oxidase subunit IV
VTTLFDLHSYLRWLVVLIAVAAIVRLALGLFREDAYDRASRALTLLFSIAIDVQVLVGIVYLIWNGSKYDYWPRERFEHMAVMLGALGLAHLPSRWKNSPSSLRYRNDLLVVVVVLALIFVGVVLLPGGMDRWE